MARETDARPGAHEGVHSLTPMWIAGALLAVATALAAGVFVGIASHGGDPPAPAAVTEDSVDVGFARDMRDHHTQAVEMSVLVRERTKDPDLRTLALDILLTQQQQAGQMYGWLTTWGADQVGSTESMAWMGSGGSGTVPSADPGSESAAEMGGHAGTRHTGGATRSSTGMPGMATDEQILELERSQGRRAKRLYLQLMVPHHQAGVAMAEYAAKNASQPQVRRLAQSIVDSQTAELNVLRSMLEDVDGPPSAP